MKFNSQLQWPCCVLKSTSSQTQPTLRTVPLKKGSHHQQKNSSRHQYMYNSQNTLPFVVTRKVKRIGVCTWVMSRPWSRLWMDGRWNQVSFLCQNWELLATELNFTNHRSFQPANISPTSRTCLPISSCSIDSDSSPTGYDSISDLINDLIYQQLALASETWWWSAK